VHNFNIRVMVIYKYIADVYFDPISMYCTLLIFACLMNLSCENKDFILLCSIWTNISKERGILVVLNTKVLVSWSQ
jgi:hypothetical protein